jgi:hypothetical protein
VSGFTSNLGVMLLVAWGLLGCSDPGSVKACTEIGCGSGLQVNFDRPPEHGTVVTLELSAAPWRVVCGVDVDCSEGLFFDGLQVEYLTIEISSGEASVRHERRPTYEEFMPNGPGCEPTCFRAEISVDLPPA